ncbi:MAG: DPP IV N-terminal domain-containing protein, partial [Myxococcota bacterium]
PDRPQAGPVPEPSIADPAFPGLYAQTSGFRFGRPSGFAFTPDDASVLYLRSEGQSAERALFQLNLASGEESQLLSAAQVLGGAAEELSAEERALRERLRMTARGLTSFKLSPDGEHALVPISGRLFLVRLEDGSSRELSSDGGYANDARFSPNGRHIACVRGGELYVIDVASGNQRKVASRPNEHTVVGLAEFVAQEEMSRFHGYWWSPDSRSLLYQETNTEAVESLYASNPIAPEEAPHGSPYPRAGRTNADVRLHLVSVRGGRSRAVVWDRERFPYVATVKWRAESPLALVVQDREQHHAAVLTVTPDSGATRIVHEEHDDAWLNIDQSVPRFIDGDRFLWSTERDGTYALELRTVDGESRTLVPAGYGRVVGVRETDVWALKSDVPGESTVVRVPLAGGDVGVVSGEPGDHTAVLGDSHWLDVFTPASGAPTYTVRNDARAVATIASRAEAFPFEPVIEYRTVGERELRTAIVRPRNFVAGASYPVLVSVYGGPGYVKVRRQSSRWLREQWQADHGFIVVSIDGRGTPGRGRAWERAIDGNVIDGPLEDQIAGLRALAAEIPELDLSRVGIYGWSFGGYFSAMATMRHPELFRVGVAGAPVCDWGDYDTHYTERFLGLPQANERGYEASNVLTYAANLERPLMIIHGTSDDNVYFVHALKMSDTLMRSGRPHVFVPLAGSTHMVADPDVAGALQARVMNFLIEGTRAQE